ncbi:MAG: DUF6527 family protein [Phycisphaerae bacterium]
MAVLKQVSGDGPAGYAIFCPGCQAEHFVPVEGSPRWGFNGDLARPTFNPSLLLRTGHYVPGRQGKRCWCDFNREHPDDPGPTCRVCHSFVREGRIQFLGDCTHELAGQTVDLPDHF